MTRRMSAALGSGLQADQRRKPREIGQFVVGAVRRIAGLPVAVDPDTSPAECMGRHDVVLEPLSYVEDLIGFAFQRTEGVVEDDQRGFVGACLFRRNDAIYG